MTVLSFTDAVERRRQRRAREEVGNVPLYEVPGGERGHAVRHAAPTADGRRIVTMLCGLRVRLRAGVTLEPARDDLDVCSRCARACVPRDVPLP